jgi:hypothetical protein
MIDLSEEKIGALVIVGIYLCFGQVDEKLNINIPSTLSAAQTSLYQTMMMFHPEIAHSNCPIYFLQP